MRKGLILFASVRQPNLENSRCVICGFQPRPYKSNHTIQNCGTIIRISLVIIIKTNTVPESLGNTALSRCWQSIRGNLALFFSGFWESYPVSTINHESHETLEGFTTANRQCSSKFVVACVAKGGFMWPRRWGVHESSRSPPDLKVVSRSPFLAEHSCGGTPIIELILPSRFDHPVRLSISSGFRALC